MRKKHRFDRKDGYYIPDMDSFHKYFAYLNPNRTECEVCMLSSIDVTEALKYLADKKAKADHKVSFFHLMLTAMARMINNRPYMNRFVCGHRHYQRKELVLSFVAKKKFNDEAKESLVMFKPANDDNFDSISKKVSDDVAAAKDDNTDKYGADNALDVVAKFPRWLMKIVMGVFRIMDYHGWFPKSFMDVDPNFSTVLLSNLGSINCDAVYHHLSNFGTNSILLTIGTIHKEEKIMDDGSKQMRDVVNFGITIDERIGDGFYFAKSMKMVQHLLNHPEMLDEPINAKVNYES